MEYKSIPIVVDENCLFRSVTYALFGTQEKHKDIRIRFVNSLVIWKCRNNLSLAIFLISIYRLPIHDCKNYVYLMCIDGTDYLPK